MMTKVLRQVLLGVLLAAAAGLRGQAMNTVTGTSITTVPTPASPWYGKTLVTLGIGWMQLGTHPLYEPGSITPTGVKAASPNLYPLSQASAYHNASTYNRALFVANAVRSVNLSQAIAKNTKEGADPLVGKGPASMSFWQWIKLGEMGLKMYGKVSAIVKALHSGQVVLDVWKLIPKVAVISENDPNAPALIMGLVPYDKGSIALAKQIVNFNDPRYYGGNLVKFDELSQLVPSLNVKPSFYGAYAHMATSDPTSRNVALTEQIMRNFHEMRIGMSMINRGMMGRSHNLTDIPLNRFSTAYAAKMAAEMQARADYWNDAFSAISQGSRMYGPEFAAQVNTLRVPLNGMMASEQKLLADTVQVKSADTWKAKAVGGTLTNVMLPLETDEYAQGAMLVHDMVNTYASDSNYDITHGIFQHENILLGLAVADAWTNKLIHDELKALRQIYAMSVTREATQRLAPYVAQSFDEIQTASRRLTRLQNTLTALQQSKASASTFFTGDDVSRVAIRMDMP